MHAKDVLGKIQSGEGAHYAEPEVSDRPEIAWEKPGRNEPGGEFVQGSSGRPGDVVQRVVLEVTLVGAAISDEEQGRHAKEHSYPCPFGHTGILAGTGGWRRGKNGVFKQSLVPARRKCGAPQSPLATAAFRIISMLPLK